ncbi:DMT family transporter [Candidatus Villigracilis saccharophilus]|uniref:DMT family transporter n=1 Tax=Candidatus Villigracilis saccharophilus TaxID=3140684 RepID=UPI00313502F2|nr:DMT family transporter [Anaerolineales bacterium]
MKSKSLPFILQALLAAIFFGASAPIAKLLLGDNIAPIFLAAFLYLGSGTGISLFKLSQRMRSKEVEAGIKSPDIKWLAGAIISGGILAPIILMISLQNTPASTASLLLNFEGAGTTVIALLFFKEAISRRAWIAIIVITLASIFLSTNFSSGFGLSLGALGIILACMLWGLDNNFTRNISGKDPLAIVAWKGLVAGTFSFFLAFFLGNQLPSLTIILSTLVLGFVSYGLSTMLFIRSMRGLGAARTSALYGTAPLAGVLLSIIIFGEFPSFMFIIAAILMIGGALLLINEEHEHSHVHTVLFHEHSHSHNDPSHGHDDIKGIHSHEHEHPAEEHEHDHMPDIHHRHGHEE